MKELSCGIIIINSNNQILGCKAGGMSGLLLDIPKGHIEEGESEIDCAIRETFEETGINVLKETLIDLGKFEYIKKKDLHLFKCNYDIENLSKLFCSTYRITKKGTKVPEVIRYEWINIDNLENKFYFSLEKVLKQILW